MGALSFKEKQNLPKFSPRIEIQNIPILNPNSVQPILKLPQDKLLKSPLLLSATSPSPHLTPGQCPAAGEQMSAGPQFCLFLLSLPGFLCSHDKNPSLPSSQTVELYLAQQNRQIPLSRLQWQTPGAWTAGCGHRSPRSVQRKGLGN